MINGAKEDVIAKAQELTGGAGMDLIIETAGTEITTRQAIHMAKKGSTIVLVGYSKSGEMTLPMSLVLDKELTFKNGLPLPPYLSDRNRCGSFRKSKRKRNRY